MNTIFFRMYMDVCKSEVDIWTGSIINKKNNSV